MDAHFFTFQKVIANKPQSIYVDIIVRGDYSFKEAKQLAEQEIAEWRCGAWSLQRIYLNDGNLLVHRDFKFVESY